MYIKEILSLLRSYLKYLAMILWLPLFVSVYFQFGKSAESHPQPHVSLAFLLTLVVIYSIIFLLPKEERNPVSSKLYRKEGLILVALIWLLTAFIGALPFYFSGTLTNPIDAYFESMSGLTTTGASVLAAKKYDQGSGEEIPYMLFNHSSIYHSYVFHGTVERVAHPHIEGKWIEGVEAVGKGLLFWRSLLQWLGGMGIVVLFVAILPALGVGGKVLYSAEVPGFEKGGITPRIKETASRFWKLYTSMTLLQVLLLYYTNPALGWFDALTISFSSVSTGGFSVKNHSIAAYGSHYTQWVVMLFMLLGSLSFNGYFYLFKGKFSKIFNAEFKIYLLILFFVPLLIAYYLEGVSLRFLDGSQRHLSFPETWLISAFQYISAQSSTGFVTADYESWPYICQVILLISMYLGGMSGSTSGGIKMIRHIMIWKIIQNKLEKIYRPETTNELVLEGKSIPLSSSVNVLIYFALVIIFGMLATLLYTLDHIDPETALSLSSCMINNIGISFRMAAPTESFAFLSNTSKLFSILWMLLGRLEFFAILVLLTPSFWTSK